MKFEKKKAVCNKCKRKFKNGKALAKHENRKVQCFEKLKFQDEMSQHDQQPQTKGTFVQLNQQQIKQLLQKHGKLAQLIFKVVQNERLKIHKYEKINQYVKIKKLIGKGSQGRVYECQFQGKQYCLKKMRVPDQFYFWHDRIQEEEYKQYTNVPQYMFFQQKNFYLIFERGDYTLSEFFRRKPDQNLIQTVFFKILQCINFLQKKKIIHRDLRSRNIMIWKNPLRVKLIDFGSSLTQQQFWMDDRRAVLGIQGSNYFKQVFIVTQQFWQYYNNEFNIFCKPQNRIKNGMKKIRQKCSKKFAQCLESILTQSVDQGAQYFIQKYAPTKRRKRCEKV